MEKKKEEKKSLDNFDELFTSDSFLSEDKKVKKEREEKNKKKKEDAEEISELKELFEKGRTQNSKKNKKGRKKNNSNKSSLSKYKKTDSKEKNSTDKKKSEQDKDVIIKSSFKGGLNTTWRRDENKENAVAAKNKKAFIASAKLLSNEEAKKIFENFEKEVSKVIVSQEDAVRGVFRAIICNGHVLLEGVPGIAKTLLVKSIARVLDCEMKRVQFTLDLLPTDITGISSYDQKKEDFCFIKGPVFTNFLLADEINRSPPKTQSALLEAMEEKRVTLFNETHTLPEPFFVVATENPIESAGVYELPEAEVDRFLFKLLMDYPSSEEEIFIMDQNVFMKEFADFDLNIVLTKDKIKILQEKVKQVHTSDVIKKYIVNIISATRDKKSKFAKYISYGASPRASIALNIASKAEALINGRDFVIPSDVNNVCFSVLRHRIILNYDATLEKITPDDIIKRILNEFNLP